MTEGLVINVIKNGIVSVILVAGPTLLISMAVGLIISIFQASTQIQEQTLTFVPKIIAVFASIIIFGPWMLHILVEFTERMFNMIPSLIR